MEVKNLRYNCTNDCGLIKLMDGKCECFNKRQKIFYPQPPNQRHTTMDWLCGNKNFVEAYTKALKEAGILNRLKGKGDE